MPYKTDQNIIGRQVTDDADEVIAGIRILYSAGTGLRTSTNIKLPTALTQAQLVRIFNGLPTVTGTQTLDIVGATGTAALTTGEKAIATGKGWTLTLV
jgi:hypothetical protein